MGLALAAVGAAVAALIECTIASRFQVAGAELQIVLVFAIVLTIVTGFDRGMLWAFVGGLSVDLLAVRPLGSTVFALLVVVGVAAAASRILSHGRWLGPVAGVFVLTPLYLIVTEVVMAILKAAVPPLRPSMLLTAAVLDSVLALLVAPPLVALKRRAAEKERPLW